MHKFWLCPFSDLTSKPTLYVANDFQFDGGNVPNLTFNIFDQFLSIGQ